jgi:hypothetical protein
MQIVTDSGAQPWLPAETMESLGIHIVPLNVTLEGKTYREGIDTDTATFYRLLAEDPMPCPPHRSPRRASLRPSTASWPPPTRRSFPFTSARGSVAPSTPPRPAPSKVPEARVTHVDTHTLSAGAGWQVEAAARARNAGWPLDRRSWA